MEEHQAPRNARQQREALGAEPESEGTLRRDAEGAEHWDVSPEEFRSYVAVEIQRWKGVIEAANIRIE